MTGGGASAGRLDLSGQRRLYGRDNELERLCEFARDIFKAGSRSKAACVHGVSGSGKTSLCIELKRRILEGELETATEQPDHNCRPIFMCGKFEQYQDYSAPYSAMVQGWERYGEELYQQREERQADIDDLKEALSSEAEILVNLIPFFAKLVGKDRSESARDGGNLEMANERVAVAFQALLRSYCSPKRPGFFFFDDLQWADANTLELLEAGMKNEREESNFVLLFGYRDDEADSIERFLSSLKDGSEHFQKDQVVDIPLTNLDRDCTNSMIADILRLDRDETLALASSIHRNTMGNPFYMIQLIQGLEQSGLLKYNFGTLRWTFNVEMIETEMLVAENVADFLMRRMETLPMEARTVLQLAACLGFTVDVSLLEDIYMAFVVEAENDSLATKSAEISLRDALGIAEAENLIKRRPSFRFVHDRIQQCAYALTPPGKSRSELHYSIGKYLAAKYGTKSSDKYIFLVADQINRGLANVGNSEERIEAVRINLNASVAAKQRSAPELVQNFLDKAFGLVKASDWENNYQLIFDIFCSLAEVESSRGRFDRSSDLIEIILSKARETEDKARALGIKAQACGWQQNVAAARDAVRDSRQALSLLGVYLPRCNLPNVVIELKRLQRHLKEMSDEDLLTLSPMSDQCKLNEAMTVLIHCTLYAWLTNNTVLGRLVHIKMMQITLENGLCNATPQAYGGYGQLLVIKGDVAEGIRFCRLAHELNKMDRRSIAPTCMATHCFAFHLRLPASNSIEPMLEGYRAGIETGNVLIGCICIAIYSDIYKLTGLPLASFATDLRKYAGQLKIFRQDFALSIMLPNYQLALALTGQSRDSDISWETIKAHGLLNNNECDLDESLPPFLGVCYNQMFVSFLLGDFNRAKDAMEHVLKRPKKKRKYEGTHINNYFFFLVDGLVGFELYKRTRKSKYRSLVLKATKWLRDQRSVNSLPLYFLLEAQMTSDKSFNAKDAQDIMEKFDAAISMLSRSGFVHFTAIANEQAGRFMLSNGDSDRAEQYLSRAARNYGEWGANVKLQQMVNSFDFIKPLGDDKDARTIRGRERFNSILDTAAGRGDSMRISS